MKKEEKKREGGKEGKKNVRNPHHSLVIFHRATLGNDMGVGKSGMYINVS